MPPQFSESWARGVFCSASDIQVVGFAYNTQALRYEAILWTLSTCGGDFNLDGSVDIFDYLDFVQAYSQGNPAADLNHDGEFGMFDYLDFLIRFSQGC